MGLETRTPLSTIHISQNKTAEIDGGGSVKRTTSSNWMVYSAMGSASAVLSTYCIPGKHRDKRQQNAEVKLF